MGHERLPYYGGRTLDAVAGVVKRLRGRGLGACVSLLPELRFRARGVELEKKDILAILPGLAARGETADLTVKLSQLGQRWAPRECRAALSEIAAAAAERGAFLWIDMERARDVDRTLADFHHVRRGASNVGICLQTYLRRTESDLRRLLKEGHPVRLVKGYYRESTIDRFPTWAETTACMKRLLGPLIVGSSRPAVGTHDESVIAEARRLLALHPRPDFEFQFFLGAKPELAEAVAAEGRRARVYVPYGRLFRYFLHTFPQMDVSRNVQRLLRRPVVR
ncbi:MAG: proline dehydrogenase family protein [Elusimicrobiota bacterium]|nr:MAG: proline dehydrogenase family protein [Elusimicrobiota bacterium]